MVTHTVASHGCTAADHGCTAADHGPTACRSWLQRPSVYPGGHAGTWSMQQAYNRALLCCNVSAMQSAVLKTLVAVTFCSSDRTDSSGASANVHDMRLLHPWNPEVCAFSHDLRHDPSKSVKNYRSLPTINCSSTRACRRHELHWQPL
jgi:hypothetical protein